MLCAAEKSPTSSSQAPHAGTTRVGFHMNTLRELLEEARSVEALLRDTLQLHIGNVALEESRHSIRQAKSVGRVTFLAYVFLPLSLITSFFGMNIQELNGQGARFRWFIVSTVCFSLFSFSCCILWLWLGDRLHTLSKRFWKWMEVSRKRWFTHEGRETRRLEKKVREEDLLEEERRKREIGLSRV